VKYGCIAEHRDRFDVALMCRLLRVSRGGYYGWRARQAAGRSTRRAAADAALTDEIREVHRASRRTYGSPRVHAELRARGQPVARKRVARLMQAAGLVARRRRRRVRTTDSAHAHPVAANVLDRQFGVAPQAAADRAWPSVWVGDITYLPTREGWLYLAVVLDLGSRRVIGWSMRHTLERGLALDALTMAITARQPGPGVLQHTDRGSQYASGDYQALLAAHGMTCSMSRKGDCYDNAVAESFFATLKAELVEEADWPTREAARAAVFEYIEVWYNRQRRHSSLGYLSPLQYEEQQQAA